MATNSSLRLENVLVVHPVDQSPAAQILLRRDLLSMESYAQGWRKEVLIATEWLSLRRKRDGILICAYCGLHPLDISGNDYRTNATRDHIMPRSKGGSDHDSNLCVSCHGCNVAKDDSEITDTKFLRRFGPKRYSFRDLRVDPYDCPPPGKDKKYWWLEGCYWRKS